MQQVTASTTRPQTYSTFESRGFKDPSHADQVENIKHKAAELLLLINDIPIPPENREAGRLVSLAKTELESSVMWAVKAYSRQ